MKNLINKDKSVRDILSTKGYTFSAEFIPPRNGEPIDPVLNKVKIVANAGIDFVSITKGAGGSLRGGTVPISYIIKEKLGVPVISHITCMEMNSKDIENYLIDHSYLGITNLLALRGDPPTGVLSEYKAGDDQYQYAHQLITKISELNRGEYLLRKGYDKDSTTYHKGVEMDFIIGAAAYPQPNDGNIDREVDYFIQKIKEGAEFGITQMIYSPSDFKIFIDKLKAKGCEIPILPGVRVIVKTSQAEFLIKNFNINIPEEYLEILKKDDNEQDIKDYIIKLSKEFKAAGAKGAHFFIMNEQEIVADIIKKLK